MNQDLGYHDIAQYPFYPGFHSMPSAEVAVALPRWNALSEDMQALFEMAVRDFARDMVQRIALKDMEAAEAARSQGVMLVTWSDAERRKFREVAREAWAEWAKKSPLAQKVYDSQIVFLKRLQLLD
jgi:TRAP-type mannitol/chloroaromatic compound transport system substrate-binding protein